MIFNRKYPVFNNPWALGFMIAFIAHLLSIILNIPLATLITKPLLLLLLLVYYVNQSAIQRTAVQWKVVAALMFSLLGDVLLMFQDTDALFFILGLAAFLLAHIFYILYFVGEFRNGKYKFQPIYTVMITIYAGTMFWMLRPYLGTMQLPVAIYTLAIASMLIMAFHACKEPTVSSFLCIMGAGLFVLSDSLLAINKFYMPFVAASFLIMLTYGMAQFFLVTGILFREKELRRRG